MLARFAGISRMQFWPGGARRRHSRSQWHPEDRSGAFTLLLFCTRPCIYAGCVGGMMSLGLSGPRRRRGPPQRREVGAGRVTRRERRAYYQSQDP
jgi:hypothetical protein